MNDLKEAVIYLNICAKLGVRYSGINILSLIAMKTVDALNSVADNNFGIATSDVWEASYSILITIADTFPNIKMSMEYIGSRSDAMEKNHKKACHRLMEDLKYRPQVRELLEKA